MKYLLWLSFLATISCKVYNPSHSYDAINKGLIDYSKLDNWAAHPAKKDVSDDTPDKLPISNEPKEVDVFFLHPTSYVGEKDQGQWNAPIDHQKTNKKTDNGTIKFQASAFNQAGNIYAPRYRQAHLHSYFTKDTISARHAFEFAFQDVKNAFEYYLQNYNQGKPIIIAAHSQGTNHAERLLKEYFDNSNLKNRLVIAYLIGMPIHKKAFNNIPPCQDSFQTGCFVSWRTFKEGVDLPGDQSHLLVTNPLSWKTDNQFVDKKYNPGSVLKDFDEVCVHLVDAQVHDGILWAHKPKFFGSFFFRTKNYHIADINFYYMSIRKDTVRRVGYFWKR